MDNKELLSAVMTIYKYCKEIDETDTKPNAAEQYQHESMRHDSSDEIVHAIESALLPINNEMVSKVDSLDEKVSLIENEMKAIINAAPSEKYEENQTEIMNTLSEIIMKVNSLEERIDVTRQTEITELKNQKEELQKRCKELVQENQAQLSQIVSLEENYNILQIKSKEVQSQLTTELSKYEDLKDILIIKECILLMTETNRSYIESLCGSTDLLAIVSLGRDEGKIKQLWQFLRDAAIREDKDTTNLNTFFEFCMKVYNASKPEGEKYTFQEIAVGSEFDISRCIKTTNSTQIGAICDVLTRCYKRGDKVVYKAVVRIN